MAPRSAVVYSAPREAMPLHVASNDGLAVIGGRGSVGALEPPCNKASHKSHGVLLPHGIDGRVAAVLSVTRSLTKSGKAIGGSCKERRFSSANPSICIHTASGVCFNQFKDEIQLRPAWGSTANKRKGVCLRSILCCLSQEYIHHSESIVLLLHAVHGDRDVASLASHFSATDLKYRIRDIAASVDSIEAAAVQLSRAVSIDEHACGAIDETQIFDCELANSIMRCARYRG